MYIKIMAFLGPCSGEHLSFAHVTFKHVIRTDLNAAGNASSGACG